MLDKVMIAALALTPAVLTAQQVAPDAGARAAASFVAGDTAAVWAEMTPEMQATIGTADDLAALRAALTDQAGEEVAILSEVTSPSPLGTIHDRVGQWSGSDVALQVTVVQDATGRIAGFWVGAAPQPAESRFADHVMDPAMRLPFDGDWTVFWGGRSITENYHAADVAQRFALDLVIAQNGVTHAGDPAALESYHCWDQPILAPAAGQVVAVEGGLPDHPIGQTDPGNPAGNHVVIDLGEDIHVFLAHLRQDSVTVTEGQQVAAGDVIGRCGNSGNTSEPHLHLHVQTTADLTGGEGIPARFVDYLADGVPVAAGEPVRGQVVAPQSEGG